MARALEQFFLDRFLVGGDLNPLTNVLKKHPQFTMNLRGENTMIYYKGLRVLIISDNGNYMVTKKYADNAGGKLNQYILKSAGDAYLLNLPSMDENQWYEFLSAIAMGIDEHKDSYENLEKEIQQQLVFENNMTSKQTDYFIIDMEYVEPGEKTEGRFDAIAWHWPHGKNSPTGLAFIEVKVGETAVCGEHGVTDHLKDVANYVNQKDKIKSLYADMKTVFKQLFDLGLCKKTPGGYAPDFDLENNMAKPQMIFVLANYYKKSKALANEFENDLWNKENDNLDVLFATSSFMGYGLYDNCMIPASDFKKMIKPKTWTFNNDELFDLVVLGKKHGTCSLYESDDSMSKVGDINIIYNSLGERVKVQIVGVKKCRFCDVTPDWAATEGEGDLSLEHWKNAHLEFFRGISQKFQPNDYLELNEFIVAGK